MMPKKLKWKAALRGSWWAWVAACILLAIVVYFEVFDPIQPLWPMLTLLIAVLTVAVMVGKFRFESGPYRYACGPFTLSVASEADYVAPEDFLLIVKDLEDRWLAHPDTQAVPSEVWKDYTIDLSGAMMGPAGQHFRRGRHIILKWGYHTDAPTIHWELGHALMYAELSHMSEKERKLIGDPASEIRSIYEHKWMRWRKDRGLL